MSSRGCQIFLLRRNKGWGNQLFIIIGGRRSGWLLGCMEDDTDGIRHDKSLVVRTLSTCFAKQEQYPVRDLPL